ncbi:hypothetical protein FGRMN_3565 [Fusarium graminum]|nr:hypothetical protein FGRMN_3565 [Fusarium graminum]
MTDKADRVISFITLAGSLLSCFATTCVLASFAIYRRHLRNFRQVLVLNLMVAVSGIILLTTGQLKPGVVCVANGFAGQFSASAADFLVLAISVTTLLTVTRFMYIPNTSTTRKTVICVAVWLIPLITSLIPTIEGEMQPSGGNWCWISATRPDLRYGVAHGWRALTILTIIGIYIYIWIYLRRHLASKSRTRQTLSFVTHNTNSLSSIGSKDVGFRVTEGQEVELATFNSRHGNIAVPNPPAMFNQGLDWNTRREVKIHEVENVGIRQGESERASSIVGGTMFHQTGRPGLIYSADANSEPRAPPRQTQVNVLQTNASEFPQRRDPHNIEIEIKRMMLLNGYPFMYVLLWTPGLVNRFVEALGMPVSETTIAALNISTQFVGFANAVTYGFNHHLRDRLDELLWTPMTMRIKKMFGR